MKNSEETITTVEHQIELLKIHQKRINDQIDSLQKYKSSLEVPNKGDWFIQTDTNTYYQYNGVHPHTSDCINLIRRDTVKTYTKNAFKNCFRRATPSEVKQHLEFLASQKVEKGEFVMGKWVMGKWTPVTNRFFDSLSVGFIIIKKTGGRIYKITKIENDTLYLDGISKTLEVAADDVKDWELASEKQVRIYNELKVRKLFLSWKPELNQEPVVKPFDITKCDFYMLTIRGEHGSKVRHTSYDVATKEATRLAIREEHPVYIMGVVAIAEPKVTKTTVINIKTK